MTDRFIRPELTVAAIIQDRSRYLLIEEMVGGMAVINQPAGHVEPGESLVAAVIRETLEETAWRFEPEATTGVYLWASPASGKKYLRVCFCGRVTAHEPWRGLDEGIIRALWLSRESLCERAMQLRSPMVTRGIDDFEAGRRLPLNLIEDLDLEDISRRAAPIAQPK